MKNYWEQGWKERYGEINWTEIYRPIPIPEITNLLSYIELQNNNSNFSVQPNVACHGYKNSSLFERCSSSIETIEHTFWHCKAVNEFWKNIARQSNGLDVVPQIITFTLRKIILYVPEDIIINRIISVAKEIITRGAAANLTIRVYHLQRYEVLL